MFGNTKRVRNLRVVFLLALFCVGVSLCSSTAALSNTHALSAAAETMVVGGNDCSDFLNGAAVGLGVGALFGCVWCAAGALVAKGASLFC